MQTATIFIGIILSVYFIFNKQESNKKLAGMLISAAGFVCLDNYSPKLLPWTTYAKIYNIVEFLISSLTTFSAYVLAIIVLLDYKGKIKTPKKSWELL